MSDRGTVWDEIERKYQRMSASPSPTMAIADLYESHRDQTESYLSAFRPVFNQVGMIVFIDGRVVGFEILYRFGAFGGNHSKLVNSYVMDALESAALNCKSGHSSLRTKASKLLESPGNSEIEIRKSVALGNDIRMESGKLAGSGRECENQILQMTVLASDNGKVAGPVSKWQGLRED